MKERERYERKHIHVWKTRSLFDPSLLIERRCECGVVQTASWYAVIALSLPESLMGYAEVEWRDAPRSR